MIVKIQPANPGIVGTVAYNEMKMSSEEGILTSEEVQRYLIEGNSGHVLVTRNVPETSSFENELERLKWKNEKETRGRKLENPTFHMSINPGINDRYMTEKEIVEFADELMQSLGYGNNPYKIFRHDDTGRTHFHIVSTRIGQDGKKIKDSYENTRCEKICRELANIHGYIYGLEEEMPSQEESISKDQLNTKTSDFLLKTEEQKKDKSEKKFIPPFSKSSEIPDTEQFRLFHNEVMKWNFSTPEQYKLIMRCRYNTEVEMYEDCLTYSGIGKSGNPCTSPISETELGIKAMTEMLQKCADSDMKKRKAQKKRLEKLTEWAIENTKNWEEFRYTMQKKGVYIVISWDKEGRPFGVTWLDKATKCAFKGSETAKDIKWLKEECTKKGWIIKRHQRHEEPQKKTNKISKPKAKKMPMDKASEQGLLEKLMKMKGIHPTKTGTAGKSKAKGDIKYGNDEDDNNEIMI